MSVAMYKLQKLIHALNDGKVNDLRLLWHMFS